MIQTTHADGSARTVQRSDDRERSLVLQHVPCCVCGRVNNVPVGVGEDFEYRTSPDTFLAVRCESCQLVYLDPRPVDAELARIYPDSYHAFAFTQEGFGLVHRVRGRLEARRMLGVLGALAPDACVLDVGCGDGFHLDLLRTYGPKGWRLEGVEVDRRAIDAARQRGFVVHEGAIEALGLPEASFDAAILIQTIEHVGSPPEVLTAIRHALKPGGRLMVVTDNTDSLDFRIFRKRHWGGYHFPRHWNLFNRSSLARLGGACGFEIERIETIVSPVNWTYSVRNALVDHGAPRWLVRQFSLSAVPALGFFTLFDAVHTLFGRGALLRATLRKPS